MFGGSLYLCLLCGSLASLCLSLYQGGYDYDANVMLELVERISKAYSFNLDTHQGATSEMDDNGIENMYQSWDGLHICECDQVAMQCDRLAHASGTVLQKIIQYSGYFLFIIMFELLSSAATTPPFTSLLHSLSSHLHLCCLFPLPLPPSPSLSLPLPPSPSLLCYTVVSAELISPTTPPRGVPRAGNAMGGRPPQTFDRPDMVPTIMIPNGLLEERAEAMGGVCHADTFSNCQY